MKRYLICKNKTYKIPGSKCYRLVTRDFQSSPVDFNRQPRIRTTDLAEENSHLIESKQALNRFKEKI